MQNLPYIAKHYRLYEVSAQRLHWQDGIIFRPFIRPFGTSWLIRRPTTPQITRSCRESHHHPFHLLFSSLPMRPTPDGPVKTLELFMFFSGSPQLQCGMQMHLLFCRPFECLMSARKQNSALLSLPTPSSSSSFSQSPSVSISLSFLRRSARRRGEARSDKGKRDEEDCHRII